MFSQRVRAPLNSLKFFFQRRQIGSKDTPQSLRMRGDDYITVKKTNNVRDDGMIRLKAGMNILKMNGMSREKKTIEAEEDRVISALTK